MNAAELQQLLEALAPRLLPVALAAARLAPVLRLAPVFGGQLLPPQARTGLAVSFAVLVAGASSPGDAAALASGPVALGAAVLREVVVGVALGVAAALPFEAARAAGRLVDTHRGAALVQCLVPTTREDASPLGDLLYLALLAAFAGAGGHAAVLSSLLSSFVGLPPGTLPAPETAEAAAWQLVAGSAALLDTAAALAAPAVAMALAVDLVLGVVGRIAPQLPLFFLGLPAKSVAGLAVTVAGAGLMLGRLIAEVAP